MGSVGNGVVRGRASLSGVRIAILVLVSPIIVIVAPLAALVILPMLGLLALGCVVLGRINHGRVRRQLRRAGRLRDAAERVAALRAEGGTLVADRYAPGWNVARLWAVRERVLRTGPQPAIAHHADLDAPAATPAFAAWCDETLFSVSGGTADLLDLSPRKALGLWDVLTSAPVPFDTVLIFRFVEDEPTIACESCGYDLTGNESGVCPECGVEAGSSVER